MNKNFMNELFNDTMMASAFLMEGITDWCWQNKDQGPIWQHEMGKDQYFMSVGLPFTKIVVVAMQYATYKNLWGGARGVYHYEVTNLVGITLAKPGFNDEQVLEEIIDLSLACWFGTDEKAQERHHAELSEWVYNSYREIVKNQGVIYA